MKNIGRKIAKFFSDIGNAVVKGDIFVKLSLLIMGAGYFGRKQYIKGIITTIFQAAAALFTVIVAIPYISKFSTLGTVEREMVFNIDTMKNEVNNYDHSFKILLFGMIGIIAIVVFVFLYLWNIIKVRELQILSQRGKHINSFREDVRALLNQKFHITLLFFPFLGITLFTIIPLLVMIMVAFTNYDQNHMPPSSLFTWVGFNNFKQLFTSTISVTFGYSFTKILIWTLIWAFFATFTTYIGGILLAMLINDKKTKAKKLWRTLFIIAIAVPQFVTLLLVRNFFADLGIVNTICSKIGLTDFLKTIGLVKDSLTYIPFLSDPNWAKVMIILINMWIGIPYLMLIATGVLMNIPADLKESAKIDGANGIQIFFKITMPYMLFVTGPYLVTSFVANINNFNVIYLLTQDVFVTHNQYLANSNAKETDLLVTWLYRLTQEYYNYKMASVIGIVVFIICATFTLFAFNSMIKGDKEEEFQ
ncbi:carbohydrate ABC transporter permease [Anaeromicropila populeti]|uniref:Maltose/maltodextrin transport system permease protein n=1 Tax=Anaeromicropila populeti TaxID=37658 RepID=A0A1I6JRF0_9FIRM|nr:sugar ABC transporter permease [Anaeromicropila populeti]SFR81552.1 carbohydrate ABC transporter membrane protein 1, CUT1 family [Anaeromicropila populeti]